MNYQDRTKDELIEQLMAMQLAIEQVNESERLYRFLAYNSNDVVWLMDFNFNFIYLSPSTQKLFGYSPEERANISFDKLYSPDTVIWLKKLLEQKIKEYYNTGIREALVFELPGIHKDGHIIHLEISAKFIFDAQDKISKIQGTSRDVSERKRINEELIKAKERAEESEKMYRLLTENSTDAVWLMDLEMNFLYQSPSTEKLTGYSFEERKNLSFDNIYSKESISRIKALIYNKIKEYQETGINEPYVFELEGTKKDGSLFCFEVSANFNLDNDGNISNIQGISRDISDRKKINQELLVAKEKAEESDRLKSAFLNNMSHELRTPLNAIIGFSQLMAKPNQPEEKLKRFSDLISISSQKLMEIITDVIEISQINANLIKAVFSKIDIVLFVKNLASSFAEKAKEKNIGLNLNMNIPFKEYFLLTDVEKFSKTLKHIIDNAIKFTSKGAVEIDCNLRENRIQISISDTGIGISEEMQDKIFKPFRQVETGMIRDYGGNGLGLSIAKAYLGLLNGSISLKSEVNKGTKVSISFPAIEPAIQIKQKEIKKAANPVKTILIADDKYNNYQYLHELLADTGIKILYVKNGQDAIDKCRINSLVDLILMDIKMPIMDGYTAAKIIKGFLPDLPIIAQTAFALETEKEQFIGIFDDYITKPIDGDQLREKLKKYICK